MRPISRKDEKQELATRPPLKTGAAADQKELPWSDLHHGAKPTMTCRVLKLGSPVAWQVASPVLPPVRSVAGWRDVRLPGVVNPAGKVPAEVASLRSAFEHQAS